tara:strand:- start:6039 stop:6872 length:834 start_codon:yes stop_codon:yes gene_type:complete
MRLKHNKKRNTAFVYEALIRELTKSIIKQNSNRKNKIVSIIKEHFSEGTELSKELNLYRNIYETTNIPKKTAEKLMIETKIAYTSLDRKKINNEQNTLIKVINHSLNGKVFNNFVPNYRNIASLYSIFNSGISNTKDKIILEEKIVDFMSSSVEEPSEDMSPIDNLVYKNFVENFNSTYSEVLSERQKDLLTKYIASFSDNGIEFKVFLNEEIGSLKESIGSAIQSEIVYKDEDLKSKFVEISNILESFSENEFQDEDLNEIIKIQSLVEELHTDAN